MRRLTLSLLLILQIGLLCAMPTAVQAFPDTPVLDTFTGTDNTSPPNSNWTNAEMRDGVAGCDLEDNAVAAGTGSQANGCYWNAMSFNADQEVYATIVDVGSTGFFALCLRVANPGNNTTDGYCVETADGTDDFIVYRLDNATPTQIGSTFTPGIAIDAGDQFGLKAVGNQICVWYNNDGAGWVEAGCATDSTYSAGGYLGLYLNGSESVGAMDDFGGGDVGAFSQMRRRLQ